MPASARCQTARVLLTVSSRAIVVLILASLFSATAAAEDEKGQTYEISVWAIRATKSNSEVSPELKPIAKELKRRFNYTGFKLERKKTGTAKTGATFATELIAGFKAQITPVERTGSRVKLKIELSRRQGKKETRLLSTTVTLNRGKFHLQGGWKIEPKGEDVLIVAVSAR